MSFRRQIALMLVCFAVAVAIVGGVGWLFVESGKGFVPTTDEFTFERDVRVDHGTKLDPTNIISTTRVPLVEVLSTETTKRYGADTINPDGAGLTVNFVIKRGTEHVGETTFVIPPWQYLEETLNEDRNVLVAEKRREFSKLVEEFTAPVDVKFTFAVVIDTTEGVGPELEGTVLSMTRATVGDLANGKAVVRLHRLSGIAYQGGFREVRPASSAELTSELESFLASGKDAAGRSSVLGGIQSVLTDLNRARVGESIRVDIWTDGLENTDTLSVYRDHRLLDDRDAGWTKLDAAWSLAELDLTGLDVHLHPLPPKSQWQWDMTQKGLEYLASRLTATSARVIREMI